MKAFSFFDLIHITWKKFHFFSRLTFICWKQSHYIAWTKSECNIWLRMTEWMGKPPNHCRTERTNSSVRAIKHSPPLIGGPFSLVIDMIANAKWKPYFEGTWESRVSFYRVYTIRNDFKIIALEFQSLLKAQIDLNRTQFSVECGFVIHWYILCINSEEIDIVMVWILFKEVDWC